MLGTQLSKVFVKENGRWSKQEEQGFLPALPVVTFVAYHYIILGFDSYKFGIAVFSFGTFMYNSPAGLEGDFTAYFA